MTPPPRLDTDGVRLRRMRRLLAVSAVLLVVAVGHAGTARALPQADPTSALFVVVFADATTGRWEMMTAGYSRSLPPLPFIRG